MATGTHIPTTFPCMHVSMCSQLGEGLQKGQVSREKGMGKKKKKMVAKSFNSSKPEKNSRSMQSLP